MNRAELQTVRLTLRPVAPQDAAAVVTALNDIAVTGWLSVVPYPYTAADFNNFQTQIAKPGETFAVLDDVGRASSGQGRNLAIGLPHAVMAKAMRPRRRGQSWPHSLPRMQPM